MSISQIKNPWLRRSLLIAAVLVMPLLILAAFIREVAVEVFPDLVDHIRILPSDIAAAWRGE